MFVQLVRMNDCWTPISWAVDASNSIVHTTLDAKLYRFNTFMIDTCMSVSCVTCIWLNGMNYIIKYDFNDSKVRSSATISIAKISYDISFHKEKTIFRIISLFVTSKTTTSIVRNFLLLLSRCNAKGQLNWTLSSLEIRFQRIRILLAEDSLKLSHNDRKHHRNSIRIHLLWCVWHRRAAHASTAWSCCVAPVHANKCDLWISTKHKSIAKRNELHLENA